MNCMKNHKTCKTISSKVRPHNKDYNKRGHVFMLKQLNSLGVFQIAEYQFISKQGVSSHYIRVTKASGPHYQLFNDMLAPILWVI
jgi:hypothetical protein